MPNQPTEVAVNIDLEALEYPCFPRHPVIFSDDDWDVQSPPKRIVFRFIEGAWIPRVLIKRH